MKTDYFLIESKANNNYLYSSQNEKILLLHPALKYFIENKITFSKLNKLKETYKANKIQFEKVGIYTSNELDYYYNKYKFIVNNGFLESKESYKSYRYNNKDIKYFLANTSQISFEVTDNCNFDCDYCIYGDLYTNRTKPEGKYLNFKLAKTVLDYLVDLWSSSLNSSESKKISIGFYGGEPLLNIKVIKQIVEYTKTIRTKHFSFSFDMTTNGVLLGKNLQFFVDNNFNIVVSLDGGTDENNSYRKYKSQINAFKDIIRNVFVIRDKYPEYFKNHINFNSVLHNRNSFSEIYSFFQKEFGKTPMVSELDRDSINPQFKDTFLRMQERINTSIHNKYDDLLSIEKDNYVGVVNDLSRFLFTYSGYVKKDYLQLTHHKNVKNKLRTGTCQPFTRKIFITSRGQILPCEKVGHQNILGQVRENHLDLNYKRISDFYNGLFNKIEYDQCSSCYMSNTCGVCMLKENFKSKKVKCSGFKSKKQFEEFFSKYITYIEGSPKTYANILTNINYE